MQALLVLCTCPTSEIAERIAHSLVEQRLAACVSLSSPMQSIYRWQGRVEKSNEVLLLIKTQATRLEALKEHILALHPYELPEILAVEANLGLEPYLAWIGQETQPPTS